MSRKKQVYEKITALYCRISLDDGGDNESMSISNQKIMLRDFAEKHGMFQYEYYVDDGYTGRNFNRPAFQRMIADIEAGKIGCVITKIVQDILKRRNVHLLTGQAVHSVCNGNIAYIVFWEKDFDIAASFNIIPAQSGQVFGNDAADLSRLNIGNHALKRRAVE